MHAKYQRHIQHARRDLILNRQINTLGGGGMGGSQNGGFTLTGPLTITITRTKLPTSVTPTSFSSSEEVATSLPTSAPVEPSSEFSSSQIVALPPTSSSSFTLFPSVIPPTSTPSIVPSGHDAIPDGGGGSPEGGGGRHGSNHDTINEGSNALLTPPLPKGGIAGIVIGCLILLLLGLFFGLRKRFQRNRLRLRGMWTRNRIIGLPTLIPGNSYEPKSYSDMTSAENGASQVTGPTSPAPQFSPAIARKISARVPPPPISYNSNEGTPSPYTGLSISTSPAMISNQAPNGDSGGGGNTGASNAPVYSPGSASLSPFAAAVVCTFITSLPDELSINVGETIRVLAEYDDGWALCMNTNGQQGMVPMECLNGGPSAAPSAMNFSASRLPDARGVRRTSSLDPTQALKVRRS